MFSAVAGNGGFFNCSSICLKLWLPPSPPRHTPFLPVGKATSEAQASVAVPQPWMWASPQFLGWQGRVWSSRTLTQPRARWRGPPSHVTIREDVWCQPRSWHGPHGPVPPGVGWGVRSHLSPSPLTLNS